MKCRCTDEGVEGSGMGHFLIVGHWPKILPQNSKGASRPAKCVYVYSMCSVYYVPYSFPPCG
jgi:hypothetical protein